MANVAITAGFAPSLVNFRGPLIDRLLQRGHVVHALAPPADDATLRWLNERGIRFTAVPLFRVGTSMFEDLRTFCSLKSAFRTIKPDVTIAYTVKPVVYGTLAAAAVGVPRRYAMITGLGYAFMDPQSSLKRKSINLAVRALYKLSLSRVHGVIFQNPDDLAEFEHLNLLPTRPPTTIVNGSGVDVTHFSPTPYPDQLRFVMIARLVADKGIGEYVAAARILKAQYPDVQCDIVGPTDPNPAAITLGIVERAVADGVIRYHGELADVRPALARASVYVLPSYREGTPRSVLEAMAMARPIITTDAPGCRETVVEGHNGFLVPIRDAKALTEAMRRFVVQPSLIAKLGANSRLRAVEKYEAGNVADTVVAACGL